MEKRYALCHEVLRRFQDAGILDEFILIGSWCLHFYRDYFSGVRYTPTIRTRDVDFLVPVPFRTKKRVDIADLLKEEGFITTFSGEDGYMKLMHPELIVEFLVPEKGKGTDKPYPLPQIGMNAQALRFLDFLAQNTIVIESEGLRIKLPHPAAFGLHKLIISKRRKSEEKSLKEMREATDVLSALIGKGESNRIKTMFNSMPVSWQKKVVNVLEEAGNDDILRVLK